MERGVEGDGWSGADRLRFITSLGPPHSNSPLTLILSSSSPTVLKSLQTGCKWRGTSILGAVGKKAIARESIVVRRRARKSNMQKKSERCRR